MQRRRAHFTWLFLLKFWLEIHLGCTAMLLVSLVRMEFLFPATFLEVLTEDGVVLDLW